jgi:sperm-associated antigen 16 protein
MEDEIPEVYSKNLELTDELALLQEQLDEAKVTSEKARSTYDKLNKQRDYHKINHRRVQQEKSKLTRQINHLKKTYESNQSKFKDLTGKYENIMKEKERLSVRVKNLEKSASQIEEGSEEHIRENTIKSKLDDTQIKKKKKKFQSGVPSEIPATDPENPALGEISEIMGSSLTLLKTFKGHLMGVTGLSYNPAKHILATASDDSTWKLWSIPNGELIMSGEGHQDWLGDC